MLFNITGPDNFNLRELDTAARVVAEVVDQDAEIIYVKSEQAKKVVKKLRFRNFPSIALFFDGSKKETWKADMDGEVDCSAKDIKGAIDDMLAEDVF